MRNVTVCVEETQEGNCNLHSSTPLCWHPVSPHEQPPSPPALVAGLSLVSIQNPSCLLQQPSPAGLKVSSEGPKAPRRVSRTALPFRGSPNNGLLTAETKEMNVDR